MMHPTIDIKTFLKPGVRAHLAGIGGVSMCPLAEVLLGMGLIVQGSDMTESDTVCQLRAQGIDVAIGHSAENLKDCDLVIRTAAIHDENSEIAGAIARGIPVYERAQAWAPSCSTMKMPCASPAPTAKPPPPPWPPISSWRPRRTPP